VNISGFVYITKAHADYITSVLIG